jgi:hypothetical protein
MWDIAAAVIAFILAFALTKAGVRLVLAWFASCCVVPAFILATELMLPDSRASAMLPIALFVGGIYGAAAGGVGALFASLVPGKQADPEDGASG